MSKKTGNKKNIMIIVIILVAVLLVAGIAAAVIHSGKMRQSEDRESSSAESDTEISEDDIINMIGDIKGSNVETYTDEQGRLIVRVTDKDGNVTEYYVNEDGKLVRRTTEDDGNGQKVIESFDDAEGNHVKNITFPDGTVIKDITTPDGDTKQEVDVPKNPLTSYISYGDSSKSQELKTPSVTKLDCSAIVGFAPMYSSSEDEEIVFGMKLPYAIGDTGMVIQAIGSFEGPYVEDGSDEELENVGALIITNTSDSMIQYSVINFKAKNGKDMSYVITNLPSNTSVMVLEKNRLAFSGNESLTLDSETTTNTKPDFHSSEVAVSASDKLVSLTNNTDKTIKTAYVYYKIYVEGGVYFGGITYRAKLENIAPGETLTQGASHFFTSNSEILSVDIAY